MTIVHEFSVASGIYNIQPNVYDQSTVFIRNGTLKQHFWFASYNLLCALIVRASRAELGNILVKLSSISTRHECPHSNI